MRTSELLSIERMVNHLPAFKDYDQASLTRTAADCAEILAGDRGPDGALEDIKAALPEALRETAYALACDVAAADGKVKQEELQLLEWLRHELKVSRLEAAAIEYGVKARYTTP